MIFSNLFY